MLTRIERPVALSRELTMSLNSLGVAAALLMALTFVTQAASMEHKIGDKTVVQAFPDPSLAALSQAACAGDAAAVTRLVRAGADPNGQGLDGVVPLFWAIDCQSLMGIEALLRAGADPNYRIPGRFTPVYQATTHRNSEILKLLLEYGGNPNTRYGDSESMGKPAYVEAIFLGSEGLWDNYYLLLNNGLDIYQGEMPGDTVAIELVYAGEYEKVIELLERGYNGDLDELGLRLQLRYSMNSREARSKLRLKAALEARGVRFPRPVSQGPGLPDVPGEWTP